MKPKLIVSLFALVLLPLMAFGQMEKGWMLVGGAAGFNYQTESEVLTIGLHPNHSYFVANNLALGAALDVTVILSEDEGTWIYGASPMIRYYFTQNKANPFLGARIGVSAITNDNNKTTELYSGGLSFGMAYFVSKNVAVELAFNYDHYRTGFEEIDTDRNDVFLGFGFQIHLDKLKAQTAEERQ